MDLNFHSILPLSRHGLLNLYQCGVRFLISFIGLLSSSTFIQNVGYVRVYIANGREEKFLQNFGQKT